MCCSFYHGYNIINIVEIYHMYKILSIQPMNACIWCYNIGEVIILIWSPNIHMYWVSLACYRIALAIVQWILNMSWILCCASEEFSSDAQQNIQDMSACVSENPA